MTAPQQDPIAPMIGPFPLSRALLDPKVTKLAEPDIALWYANNALRVMADDILNYAPLETPEADVRQLLLAIAKDVRHALGEGTMPERVRRWKDE